MISKRVLKACCSAFLCFLMQIGNLFGAQTSPTTELVEIDGLKSGYTSCTYVSFSVKNISQQEVYVEVYAERFESGSWDYEDYPYDLKDPKSRYVKRVLINPDMLKPGTSLPITYNRCLRPTFIKESDKQYRKAIIEKDTKSATPALHRFRVQVYVLDQGHVKFVKNVFSEPFKRLVGGGSESASSTIPLERGLARKEATAGAPEGLRQEEYACVALIYNYELLALGERALYPICIDMPSGIPTKPLLQYLRRGGFEVSDPSLCEPAMAPGGQHHPKDYPHGLRIFIDKPQRNSGGLVSMHVETADLTLRPGGHFARTLRRGTYHFKQDEAREWKITAYTKEYDSKDEKGRDNCDSAQPSPSK